MCDPLSAAIALAVIGTGTSYLGEQKAASARERTFMAERQRQKGLEGEQIDRFKDSLAQTENMLDPDAVARAAKSREDVLTAAVQPRDGASSYLPGAASAPAIVATAGEKQQDRSAAETSALARAVAALGGTGDQMLDLNTQIGRNSTTIGQLGGFQSGSLGVLNDEMRAASAKGGTLRTLGGLAQQIGTAWMGAQLGPAATGGGSTGSMPTSGWGIPGIY